MTFTGNQVAIVKNTHRAISDINLRQQDFMQKNHGYENSRIYNEKMAAYEEEKEAVRKDAVSRLGKCLSEFSAATESRGLMGNELTADAALLSGNFTLTEKDLNAMSERTENQNPTMLRLINEYAKKNDIVLQKPYYTPEEISSKADNFTAYCKNAVTLEDYYDLLNDSGKLEKITPDEIKGL